MRVVIDIQSAIAQRAGVGRYTKSLVERLGHFAEPGEMRLFYFDFQRKGVPFPVENAEQKAVHWIPGRLVQQAWKTIAWPPFDWFAGPADVYHFPNFILPPLSRGKSVVTIHDLAFLRHPETLEPHNLRYLKARIEQTVRRADRIIAVSEFTARELRELLGVPAEKVVAIPQGIAGGLKRPSDAAIVAMRKTLGLERPYLLTVGTIEPRKNIAFLVDVFEKLADFDGDLLISGQLGWKFEPILDRMQRSTRAGHIRYLNYAEEAVLPALYAGAELFVFPSLYEGFGFPPLEAMACGTPVLSSRGGSLPEILGGAAEYLDGFEAEAWAERIRSLVRDRAKLQDLRRRGLERSNVFSWGETARRTWEVFESTVGPASSSTPWRAGMPRTGRLSPRP